jgi:hypothetical protein
MAATSAEDGVHAAARPGFTGGRDALDSTPAPRSSGADDATTRRTTPTHAALFAEARTGGSKGRRGVPGSVVWRATHASIPKRDSGAASVAAAEHDS